MRATAQTTISAPIQTVWEVVSDPERALRFLSGVTRWEVAGDTPVGLGARYRMLLRVGSAEIGGLIEVVEWDPPREIAWTSITGVDQRGRWRLRPLPRDRTRAEIRLSGGVAGSGLAGWIAERVAQPIIASHARTSVRQLARLVEHERMRSQAAERRTATSAPAGAR
jgi:carbon monoxide dehydrogenase subunit G